MDLHVFIFVSAILTISEGFTVKGSSGPLVVPLGGSVVLPCSVDSLLPLEDLEVEWRRSDTETLIHLYQDEDIRPEAQHQDYHDRAHFFTEDIKHGNFSLLLNNLTAEDEGQYTCKVHTGQESGETVVEIKHVERLIVSGSSRSISASVGENVTLSCSVDSHIKPEEVSWRKEYQGIPVLLYQDNEVLSDASHERYRDRVEFFTDEIHRGNFSLRLKRVTIEDMGVYICQVFTGRLSANTTVKLKQNGFSALHAVVLILCIAACGSAVILFCLIYCRSVKEEFVVNHSSQRFYDLGDSLDLPCYIDPQLLTDSLKVEWRRSDSETLVHLYQDGDIRPEAQHQDYHGRANFFTEDIKHGNFSLKLKDLREEDKGIYTCTVYSGQRSVFYIRTKLVLGFFIRNQRSFFPLGDSAVLPCSIDKELIKKKMKVEWRIMEHQDYHKRANLFKGKIKNGDFSPLLKKVRAEDKEEYTCKVYSEDNSPLPFNSNLELDTAFRLQLFLVFCPNIIMFFAFVFWGVSEGSVNETIFCCALYILRPLMLLWVAPYVQQFTGKIKTIVKFWSFDIDYIFFRTIVYSVFFKTVWEKIPKFDSFDRLITLIVSVIVLLFCLFYMIYVLAMMTGKLSERIATIFNVLAEIIIYVLPSLQLILMFYTFKADKGIYIVAILPVLTALARYNWNAVCGTHIGCSPLVMRLVWFILFLFMNAVLIYFYNRTLENENDRVEWACIIGFLQVLWTVWNCLWAFQDWEYTRITAVYLFGSVGVVLISAVSLMTELILKTVNGEGLFGDLRIIVFSSESLFAASVLMLLLLSPWIKKDLQCPNPIKCKKASSTGSVQNQCSPTAAVSDETQATGSNQNAGESQEMKPLLNTQESDRNTERDESQTDSVRSQP